LLVVEPELVGQEAERPGGAQTAGNQIAAAAGRRVALPAPAVRTLPSASPPPPCAPASCPAASIRAAVAFPPVVHPPVHHAWVHRDSSSRGGVSLPAGLLGWAPCLPPDEGWGVARRMQPG